MPVHEGAAVRFMPRFRARLREVTLQRSACAKGYERRYLKVMLREFRSPLRGVAREDFGQVNDRRRGIDRRSGEDRRVVDFSDWKRPPRGR